jgi:hypothetical protein
MKVNPVIGKLFLYVLMIVLLAGCGLPASSSVSVWIDVPLDHLVLTEVQPINIDGHAASPAGISRVEIRIDGVLLTSFDDPAIVDGLAAFHTDWTPPDFGDYTIEAIAYSPDGTASAPDTARVIFDHAVTDVQPQCAAAELVAPLLVSPADGAVVDINPVLSWAYPDSSCHPYSYQIDISEDDTFADISWGFGTLDHLETSRSWPLPAGQCYYWRARAYVPDETGPASPAWQFCIAEEEMVSTETPTPEPVLEPVVQFWADPLEIQAGACTTLKWHVENVQEIIFGGIAQPFDGSYEDCLCESAAYPLTIYYSDGSQEKRTVEIKVKGSCESTDANEPAEEDTTPPPAPELVVPENGVSLSCRASQSMSWLPVSDASGILHYEVQVERHAGDGNWQPVSGSPFSVTDKSTSNSVECGWTYRWRVRAVDGAGNTGSWSGWFQYSIPLG